MAEAGASGQSHAAVEESGLLEGLFLINSEISHVECGFRNVVAK